MRHRAEAAQVEVPLEGLLRQVVLADAGQQQVQVVFPLGAAHDLAVAFGREQVHPLDVVGVLRVALHVEGLDGRGPAVDHHRPVEQAREHRLVRAAEVLAVREVPRGLQPLRDVLRLFGQLLVGGDQPVDLVAVEVHRPLLHAAGGNLRFARSDLFLVGADLRLHRGEVLFEHLQAVAAVHVLLAADDGHRVVVGQAREAGLHPLQGGGVALQHLELLRAVAQHVVHDVDDEVLDEVHVVVQVVEGHLRLDHPELGEVATGLGLLRAEGGTEGVDQPVRHGQGLAVELAGLAEVGGLAVEVGLEQRGGAFHGVGREQRRVELHETALLEEGVDGVHQAVAHAHHGPLPGLAQPQVAVVHEELHPVRLAGDGVLGPGVQQLQAAGLDLLFAHALVVHHGTGERHGVLELQGLGHGPGFRGHPVLGHHRLAEAAAVPQAGEDDALGIAAEGDPALEGDGLAFQAFQVGDAVARSDAHGAAVCSRQS